MSERLIALADAAEATCTGCAENRAASTFVDEIRPMHDKFKVRHRRDDGAGASSDCDSEWIRRLVEREHPGLGSKPTKIWRETEWKVCGECDGEETIPVTPAPDGSHRYKQCPRCNGTGKETP